MIVSALFSCGFDLLSKKYIRSLPPDRFPMVFAKGHIVIAPMENPGLAGGRLSDRKETVRALTGLSFLAFLPILGSLSRNAGFLRRTSLGFLAGGAAANVIDRHSRGSVTDFLVFPKFPAKKIRRLVYNPADLFLFLGLILTLLPSRPKK